MRKFIAILLSLIAPALLAHEGHEGMTKSKAPELGASAAIDGKGRLWLVDAADGHVRLRHSDDFGRTLSAPVMVNATAEPIYAEGENRPKIAFGKQGELYVSWSQPRAKPWTGFVRFARSTDGGAHFSAPLTVHHDRAEITHRFDAMAVDGQGRIAMAWIDKRNLEAANAKGKPYLGAAIYTSVSSDAGISFAPEQKLADQSCECCRIAMARTPQGEIGAFFRAIYGDNIRDHAYAVLHADGRPNEAQRATFSEWHLAGCPHHGPGLAIASDGVRHAVWYEAKDKPTLWYGQLDPGHAPKHALAIAGPGASHADIAVNDRQVWVVWNQVGAHGYELMVRSSQDGGEHFDEARQIANTSGAVASPQLLLWQGRAFVAWNTAAGFRLIPTEAL
ncbi:sialidase family protein [Dyella subtropica]|uniref:sialidase family protein n=1 Tax=Dyella subtropica TaxID=2992127 RepID=UPI00225B4582|nr:sialidase family protein [Dyella subtropica]